MEPTTESAEPVPDAPADSHPNERAHGAGDEIRGGGAPSLVLDVPAEGAPAPGDLDVPPPADRPEPTAAPDQPDPAVLPDPPPAPPDLPNPPDDGALDPELDLELDLELAGEFEQLDATETETPPAPGDPVTAELTEPDESVQSTESVETVDTVESVETVETVESVDTLESVDTVEMVESVEAVEARTDLADLPDPPVDLSKLPPAPAPAPPALRSRRPRLRIALAVIAVLLVVPSVTYARALTKEGQESFAARTTQWARDMQLGFVIDWAERRKFATDEYADATGDPDSTAFAPSQTTVTAAPTTTQARSTTTTIPHLPPPARMIGPVLPMAEGEGVWEPTGPLTGGMPGVYTTKVRPDTIHKQLTIFVAWIDPKLTSIELFPGTNLPGGKWNQPNFVPAERYPQAIMAANGGFRMDQSRGGYYAEGREPYKLRDGAASLVLYKDGRADVGLWGRDVGREQLDQIVSVRQNLELMVDDGRPIANLLSRDWGAELPNSYFVWRSAWGVTAQGALIYIGGPALKPDDLAQHLVNAGAVRAMQGDINPEWVTSILFSTDEAGRFSGRRGLPGASNLGGMYSSDNRYLNTDTRDFIGVFAR